MPVPNSPHIYRRVIPVEPPPESDEDFESQTKKPPQPRFTSKFEAGKYTSGVEAFLNDDGAGLKYTNVRKELFNFVYFVKIICGPSGYNGVFS